MLLRLKPLLKKPVALALCCRRTNMAAVGGAGEVSADKYTCCEDGKSDCPCFTSEKSRPPPAPVALAPMKVTIEAGTAKYFCSCGQSKKFPFCDGSHKEYNAAHGTNFASIKVEAPEGEARDVWACMCGHSKNRPFCDGSHKRVVKVVAGEAAAATAETKVATA